MKLRVLVGVAACATGATAWGQLTNPSFEAPGTSTIFDGWNNFENAFPDFSIFRSGFVGVKLFGNGGAAYNAAGVSQGLPTTPGQAWEGRAWVLNSSTDPIQASNFASVNIEWRDASDGLIGFVPVTGATAATPTDVWQEVTVTGVAPAGAATARLALLHIQGPELAPGAVFFDDASLAPVTSTGVVNPGFESTAGNTFAGWTKFGNVFPDSSFVRTGSVACKMFGNFTGGENASGVFQDFAASPGQTWTGSAFAGTVANDRVGPGNFAVLNIEWRDATNQLISFDTASAVTEASPTNTWLPVTVQGTAPAGTVVARIVLLHIQPAFSGGAVWWDDVTFGQGGQNPPCDPDVNADGNVDQDDIACLAQAVGGTPDCLGGGVDPDFNRDGNVDQDDISRLEQVVAGADCP
ncbi:MAG: hypothetical protein SFY69_07275 [Planctomycetota bacterium]|nr:hypothetical protein [Planctomycetota bacterium]